MSSRRKSKTDGLIKTTPKEDLTGRIFGKLTVIKRGPDVCRGETRYSAWYCLCSCGNPEELLIPGTALKNGRTKSCGCKQKDSYKDHNQYNINGEYGRCLMNDGKEFIFDLEDYGLIRDYRWHSNTRGYIVAKIYDPTKTTKRKEGHLLLHRYLMNVHNISWKECVVDHINGDVTDNRKRNLRVTTQSKNAMNAKKKKNNTTGTAGVSKIDEKWISTIGVNNKLIYLGVFSNIEDAVKARKDAEEEYFGEYSYDNSRLRGGKIADN